VDIINAMKKMSFSARDLANAADIYDRMLREKNCAVILTLAGSTSAAGCMQIYVDLVKNNMVDAIVATGASIVDMDFFEALGFKHYQGTPFIDDKLLRKLYIDRIYDTFISENDLQACDRAIKKIADVLDPRPYSSREFIAEMGRYLIKNAKRRILWFRRPMKTTCRFSARRFPTAPPASVWYCISMSVPRIICPLIQSRISGN